MHNYVHRQFGYRMPADVQFGPGLASQIGEVTKSLGGTKALVVTDAGVINAGVAQKVYAGLDNGGVGYEVFSDIKAEPDAKEVEAGVDLAKKTDCDVVVGVGGGSCMDAGKAISAMMTNEGHIRDYAGLGLIKNPGVPLVAVPTTAGTGSEATIWAVISEKERDNKFGVGSYLIVPKVAVCDPELSLTLLPRMTALSGIDALAHALESFINKATQPISEALSEQSITMIGRSLRKAVHWGESLEARSDMLLASTMAAMAFNPTRLGLSHALAMPLGAKGHVPHSEAVAVTLGPVMRFNLPANHEKFARLAVLLGENPRGLSLPEAAELGVVSLEQLLRDVDAPDSFASYGYSESLLKEIAEDGMESGNVPVNPRITKTEDLLDILKQCV